jgi:hypothetical protein
MDEPAGDLVVARDRPRTLEHRRLGDGGRRQQRHAEVDREGGAEPLAEGPLDKGDLRPAAGAEHMGLPRRAATADAGRGVDDAQRRPSGARAGADQGEPPSGARSGPGV